MARRVILIDDFSGNESEDVKTHVFALNDKNYEIDMSDDNAEALEKALAPFIEKGREITSLRAKALGNGVRTAADRERSALIREWGRENGKDVPERGRLPESLVAEYDAAHNGSQSEETDDSEESAESATESQSDAAETQPKPAAPKGRASAK